jgi:hypothetical protein
MVAVTRQMRRRVESSTVWLGTLGCRVIMKT